MVKFMLIIILYLFRMTLNFNNNNNNKILNTMTSWKRQTVEEIKKHFSINIFNGTLFLLLKWGISHFYFALGTTVYVASLTSTLQVRFYRYYLLWCTSLIIFSSGIDLHKFHFNPCEEKISIGVKTLAQ